MVWYPAYNYYRSWRRNRFRRWRIRRPLRTRRRRRHRVRRTKRKKTSIPIRQWQPNSIRKCHIKGLECLLLFNDSSLAFNSTMYKDSIVPPGFPGGGRFSVMKFILQNLYDMHKHCYNWWTSSNQDLPLCRYLGCKIRCYRSEFIDYIIKFDTNLPATSNKLTYPSTQPSMMMISSHKYLIPSRKTNKNRKPYKTIRIRPPAKLQNKWYFQKELQSLPLLVIHTAAASLTQYYINTFNENNNITINSINTTMITNREFRQTIWPFKQFATTAHYFYEYTEAEPTNNNFLCKHLVPLTNIRQFTQGSTFAEAKATYCDNFQKFTGNPFVLEHRNTHGNYYYSTTGPATFTSKWKALNKEDAKTNEIQDNNTTMALTKVIEPLIEKYRYNPFKDTGKSTAMYLLKCDESTLDPNTSWNPPPNPDIILTGFPLWLNIWGYLDFQIRLEAYSSIMTNTLLVIKTDAFTPKPKHPIVLIDSDYFNNRSPFEESVNELDKNRWYPQTQYQTQQINKIAQTGPGTPKLYKKTSDQITIEYDFYFKWGGDPARMITVNNPSKQIIYPMPSDEHATTSLQNPAQAIDTTLYSFDQRHDSITKTALQRLQRDWDITNILSSITETTGTVPEVQGALQNTQTQETTEKEKEALLLQLLNQQHKQQQLRHGIFQLMKQLDT
uniref:Capsid protein n=1 Tax=Torque teno mini virus 10 TaxID=2065036 RepID=A0A3S8RKE9_9VIRU|nr:hypothetical protein ORF1 [Torque teno mini virus 10]